MRDAVIVGVADVPLVGGRIAEPTTPLRLLAQVAGDALSDAGIGLSDVDGLLCTGAWNVPWPGPHVVMLADYLGIRPRFVDGTNVGGSAFESHVAHAALAIQCGMCDVALVTYASTQKSDRRSYAGGSKRAGWSGNAESTMQFEAPWGLLRPSGAYALAANRHMYQYGTTSEQLAEVAVAARQWAQLNPAATRREPLTIDDVLASPMLTDPLHVLDSCLVTDGAGAVVLTSAEHARAIGARGVRVSGFGESVSHWTIGQMPDVTSSVAADSGAAAMQMAGATIDDIDVVQVYDSFTITTIMTLEALGFCAPGEGGPFVADGNIRPGGRLPVNTSGGGLSYAHPGMFGIFLLIEAVRQLRGEAGERQVDGAATALVNGTGGTFSSTGTCVLTTS